MISLFIKKEREEEKKIMFQDFKFKKKKKFFFSPVKCIKILSSSIIKVDLRDKSMKLSFKFLKVEKIPFRAG